MAIDWDDLPLSPWEQQVIAALEDEFGRDDPGVPGRAGRRPMDRPGPLLFVGVAVAAFGTVLAFGVPAGHTPLPIAGFIVMLVGLLTVWNQL